MRHRLAMTGNRQCCHGSPSQQNNAATYRLATLALSSGWELPDMSLISLAIWSNIAGKWRVAGSKDGAGREIFSAKACRDADLQDANE